MSLTQQQIDECGEAFNAAMVVSIPVELRNRLVIDVQSPTHAVGDAELIAGVRKVLLRGLYINALNAYLAILTASAPSSPPPVTTPHTTPPPAPTPVITESGGSSKGVRMVNPATGLICEMFISENDDGLRLNYNWLFPPGQYETFSVARLHQLGIAFETDGAISMSARNPMLAYDGSPLPDGEFDYPQGKGKNFKIYPIGFDPEDRGQATEWLSLISGTVGRGMELMTADATDDNPSMYRPKFRIKGDGSADPTRVFVGGKLRVLAIDAEGRPAYRDLRDGET